MLAVLVFLLAVCGGAWACSQPFSKIVADMPRYTAKIHAAVSEFDRRARTFASSQGAAPKAEVADGIKSWRQYLWKGIGSFVEAAGIAAFVPFLMMVMLSEKEALLESFARVAGGSYDIGRIERETARMVRAYFFGNLFAAVVMAFLHWLVFAGLGLKNAVGLGLATGFLTQIPLIGLFLALVLPTGQALLQFGRPLPFIVLAASITGLHLLNANYVIPRLIGGRVKINATAATIGLLFWGWLWGGTGFVLAVPLTALLKIMLESGKETEAYAGLLAAQPRVLRARFGPERHGAQASRAPSRRAEAAYSGFWR